MVKSCQCVALEVTVPSKSIRLHCQNRRTRAVAWPHSEIAPARIRHSTFVADIGAIETNALVIRQPLRAQLDRDRRVVRPERRFAHTPPTRRQSGSKGDFLVCAGAGVGVGEESAALAAASQKRENNCAESRRISRVQSLQPLPLKIKERQFEAAVGYKAPFLVISHAVS